MAVNSSCKDSDAFSTLELAAVMVRSSAYAIVLPLGKAHSRSLT